MNGKHLPDTVEDIAIGIDSQHDVLHGRVMDKRAFRVDEEHIRNPNLLHKPCVEGAALVAAGGEGQAVILPVMPQVQSHGEVLENRPKHHTGGQGWSKKKVDCMLADNKNQSNTDHVNFGYAVNALHLDINPDRNS